MPNYHLITPIDLKPQPDKYERIVAQLCAEKFQSDILFVKRGVSTTPDIQVMRTKQFWEIKNIRGKSNHTVEDNLRKASKQSGNVIISLLAAPKLDASRTESRIRAIVRTKRMPIRAIMLITKDKKVIDIK